MLKRIALVIALAAATLAVYPAQAQMQIDPNNITPEQQQMMQQMQDMGQQIQNNIQQRGIDPQELGAQFQQAMQGGDDPMDVMQQMLVDNGLATPDQLNQMFGTVRKLALSTIRQQLGSTDEEWAVIDVKLQRVVVALSDAEQDTLGRLSGRMLSGANNSPMTQARKELKTALTNPNVSDQRLTIVLTNWRREHEKAKKELAEARADLVNVLTLRQEGILVNMGVL